MDGLDPETRKEIAENTEELDPDQTDTAMRTPRPFGTDGDDLEDQLHFETVTKTTVSIRFICPNCGGGFSGWDVSEEKRCPFCHTEAGEFGTTDESDDDLEAENERLRDELADAEQQIEQLQSALEEVQSAFD